jgi:dimethylamine/trimethylamine dehydrogenase
MHALLVEKVHEHGSLAGIELVHSGMIAANLYTRDAQMGPANLPVTTTDPVQARRMSKGDIADLRRWHRAAVERSLRAGYDLVYVYAAHGLTTLQHFLSRRFNDRTDEYGGSISNRARLLREILEDTVETVAGRAAVACRICVHEQAGDLGIDRGEIEAILGIVGELPDVWDFMVGEWDFDSITSRFAEEGAQEEYVRGLKALTSKPVVGVGRFTSADTMVRMVRDGVLDFIGAARPSIADPFLPKKIEEGRWEDIRECIGCNICVTGDATATPIRCTQNPTMGEEWRRGWHPERIRAKESDASVLVVGAGPAGLEAAMMLGRRGYEVVLAEAGDDLGGRVALEARLPGLAAWIRVVDYRRAQLARMPNVEVGPGSRLTAEEALSYEFDHIAVATGARWRADGVGRWHTRPLALSPGVQVLTPDDLLAEARPDGSRVLVYDDDHYYMGGVLAEVLAREGKHVTLVTPEPLASAWTVNTMEQTRIQGKLLELGVEVAVSRALVRADGGAAVSACVFTGREREHPCDAVVIVAGRLPQDGLAAGLAARIEAAGGGPAVRTIGDAWSPGTIAAAVWDGRRYAEELDAPAHDDALPPFRREIVHLAAE